MHRFGVARHRQRRDLGRGQEKARVVSKWKPILLFSKGDWSKAGEWFDVSMVQSKEKDWHEWQQPLEEVSNLVRYFSEPNDLVVDPLAGGFTTAIACLNLGRRCVACDVDEAAVIRGQDRLQLESKKRRSSGLTDLSKTDLDVNRPGSRAEGLRPE